MQDDGFNLERYIRHLSLDEFSAEAQQKLLGARILMIGAGGLGSAALPYLAGAGTGHITLIDHDVIERSNLHRQVIYKDRETGQSKAERAAELAKNINPDVSVIAQQNSFDTALASQISPGDYDLILDGSDNFKTKLLANDTSLRCRVPLVSASVIRFDGMAAIFAGYLADAPCYRCLFPQLPANAGTCNEAGVMGTAAGLTGLYQAHLAIGYLAGFEGFTPGRMIKMDYRTLKATPLTLTKDEACGHCSAYKNAEREARKDPVTEDKIDLLGLQSLPEDALIIDVREAQEIELDPIKDAQHIPLMRLPENLNSLPRDRTLALVCAANVRSRHGAEYLKAAGFEKVCVLDKFSF